ncbi:97338198-5913-4742-84f5-70c47488663f [Thermothielavioides terrestris]|uniref:97338198-5913-4742-84f5-70c47488663f n=1 Tax=Thermothielavioides terrestris TaxID=2587410 RepID=A0A446BP65_9PEZI|nr:97338198-5913-4742-84f5-70c47488663f [Thermothielavioides terrestris]
MSALSVAHGAATTIFSNLFVKLPVPRGNPELPNQVMIVTGSNTGLGLETSRHLLRLGLGKLIMAVRNLSKGHDAKQDLLKSTGRDDASIEVWPLDMDSYESVKAFARRAAQLPRLDGVLANAGIMTRKFSLSEGHEKTLTVNVISTFLLCLLLLPKLRQSAQQTGRPARFVIPNSALHYMAPLAELAPEGPIIPRLDDPAKADMAGRYPLSKLLVLYAVRELAERCKDKDKGRLIIINTPNPSYCVSNLARETSGLGARAAEKLLARTTEEGSRTLYHALCDAGEESNGQYLTNCHVQTPSRHAFRQCAQPLQGRFFDELLATLEKIQPGISSNI